MSGKNILLHVCCAPCSVSCITTLRQEGLAPVGYWYNPNIHPYMEYAARRDCLVDYAQKVGMPLYVQEDYGLRDFCRAVCEDLDNRCGYCYGIRLYAAAKFAAENGFDSFTSTLFVSPYQDHEKMRTIAEAAGKMYGVEFLYRDFRPGFREGQAIARQEQLYMQKYCGCVFSEGERYGKKIGRDLQQPLKFYEN
ncbi:MAG: epoxyqueuosine reductase QueH [Oscillospiraceae bacterium]|nr:epoxyqueuosine reductase QueH [Oscillospiraceae bacterium]